MEWIAADDTADCEHWPNESGARCIHCGLRSQAVDPEELARELWALLERAYLERQGQVSWLGA